MRFGRWPALSAAALVAAALVAAIGLRGAFRIDRNQAAEPMSDLAVHRDIAYAPGDRRALDIYAPARPGPPRAVIVYLYGGAWTSGAKAQYAWVGAGLARQGYVAVIPDYRIYPPATWPSFLQDSARALAFVKAHIAQYGGDPAKLVLVGHSSGAFNALSLAVEPRWLDEAGLDARRDLKAVIGLSGVYNMLPLHGENENAIFAPSTGYAEMKHHVDGKSPPLLLLVGAADRIAGREESEQMAARVREKGGAAELIVYPGLQHDDTQAAFGKAQDAPPTTIRADIARFLAAQGVNLTQAAPGS
ncbi:alpha/beta hydrolase [Novosphingobium flavum]|uniref:Alpha/beta hydrolase n=1 Tax=Novosphingobium flavum TaxID=1778672 RepID=A0A7X1KL25_9SPHN|nr:alpha/beta hydrolase [Novosphingobium flavum]MBC2665156.1 alpha/beta hydrolase [Novosphingobium flavum]